MAVSAMPGLTALQRTFGARDRASDRLSPMIAALDVV